MSMNKVISPYRAIVDGESTPFAGCNNTDCTADCLRKDPQLLTLHDHNCPKTLRFYVRGNQRVGNQPPLDARVGKLASRL